MPCRVGSHGSYTGLIHSLLPSLGKVGAVQPGSPRSRDQVRGACPVPENVEPCSDDLGNEDLPFSEGGLHARFFFSQDIGFIEGDIFVVPYIELN